MWAVIAGTALAILAASGKEARISSRAADNTPVYGSTENARRASDILQNVSVGLALAVYAIKHFTPADGIFDYAPYEYNRAGNGGPANDPHITEAKAVAGSGTLAFSIAEALKRYTERERPDASDTRSFPSAHSMAAAWGCYGSAQMISGMRLEPRYELPIHGALVLVTAGTAWGRVEGQKHYAGDVLAGMLLGAALTEASFAVFGDGGGGKTLDIRTGVERGVTTTVIAAVMEF